jgi:hypothetical protein
MNAPLRTVVKWQNATDEGGDGALRPLMERCPQFCRVLELRIVAKKSTEIRWNGPLRADRDVAGTRRFSSSDVASIWRGYCNLPGRSHKPVPGAGVEIHSVLLPIRLVGSLGRARCHDW